MALRPYIVGNWKMNGTRAMLAEARAIDRAAVRLPGVEVGLAPPFTLIHEMAEAVQGLAVGGQDCHELASGAYTGDVSAAMLADAGARFVIVGHSERRIRHRESVATVRAKVEMALATDLSVLLCVGETEAQRDAGRAALVVADQLAGSLPLAKETATRLSIGYEPVWAIGTGRIPSLDDIARMHQSIREVIAHTYGSAGAEVRILYGGSVTPANAAEILAVDEVGGALVGGASLVAESFAAIISSASQVHDPR